MREGMAFQCSGQDQEVLPEELIMQHGLSYAAVYTKTSAMAVMAEALCQQRGDSLCQVPFCVSVEAECLGASVEVVNGPIPPALRGYCMKTWQDLENLQEMDFSQGIIQEVLACVKKLAESGHVVSLRVEGPFTILAMLMDLTTISRCYLQHPLVLQKALQKITDYQTEYVRRGILQGARVISYADPSGIPQYIGPKFYRELCGSYTYRLMMQVEPFLQRAVVHICGRTSLALQHAGFCEAVPAGQWQITYGEAVCLAAADEKIRFIGHNCLHQTNHMMQLPLMQLVWHKNMEKES